MATKRITDADTLKSLVMWARRERIAVHTLTVGTIHMEFSDLQAAGPPPRVKSDDDAKATIYQRYGGALLEQTDDGGAFDEILEDDQDEMADA